MLAGYQARHSWAGNGDGARPGRSHDQIANASRRKNQTSRSRCLEQRRSNCGRGPGCESDRTLASGKMDESVKDETVEANASPTRTVAAADHETATPAPRAAATAAPTPPGP